MYVIDMIITGIFYMPEGPEGPEGQPEGLLLCIYASYCNKL